MRQIYDFEREIPPALNEKMLREELRRRGRRREVALLAMASVLLQLTLLMAGVWLLASAPALSLVCFGYAAVSVSGSGAIAIIYTQKVTEGKGGLRHG